jgi:hypothetical protein
MLSSCHEVGLLSSQLSWLLSAETPTAQHLHTLIQPRAADLPLHHQNDLSLTAAGLLSSLSASQSSAKLRGQLLDLLAVLASQPAYKTSGRYCSTVSQTASWALQQQQEMTSSSQTTGWWWVMFAGAVVFCVTACFSTQRVGVALLWGGVRTDCMHEVIWYCLLLVLCPYCWLWREGLASNVAGRAGC